MACCRDCQASGAARAAGAGRARGGCSGCEAARPPPRGRCRTPQSSPVQPHTQQSDLRSLTTRAQLCALARRRRPRRRSDPIRRSQRENKSVHARLHIVRLEPVGHLGQVRGLPNPVHPHKHNRVRPPALPRRLRLPQDVRAALRGEDPPKRLLHRRPDRRAQAREARLPPPDKAVRNRLREPAQFRGEGHTHRQDRIQRGHGSARVSPDGNRNVVRTCRRSRRRRFSAGGSSSAARGSARRRRAPGQPGMMGAQSECACEIAGAA